MSVLLHRIPLQIDTRQGSHVDTQSLDTAPGDTPRSTRPYIERERDLHTCIDNTWARGGFRVSSNNRQMAFTFSPLSISLSSSRSIFLSVSLSLSVCLSTVLFELCLCVNGCCLFFGLPCSRSSNRSSVFLSFSFVCFVRWTKYAKCSSWRRSDF